jgi:hypothetical protein
MLNYHRYLGNEGLSLKKCLSKHLSVFPKNITLANGPEDFSAYCQNVFNATKFRRYSKPLLL